MDRRAAWILGLVFGGLFLCLFLFMALAWIAIGLIVLVAINVIWRGWAPAGD